MSSVDHDVQYKTAKMPRKRFFRQRAHANPFSDHSLAYPTDPSEFNIREHFSTATETDQISILDVGCGYGGFLVSLSELYPDQFIFGLEIRTKLVEYVKQRIAALRINGSCMNAQVIRTNAMKFLPNFFMKGQLEKMFFLFPDPHFKRKKHKARIITQQLLTEYAYFLKSSGELYIATDVEELFIYMQQNLDQHPLFRRIPDENVSEMLKAKILFSTEESMKVDRKGGKKFMACFQRI